MPPKAGPMIIRSRLLVSHGSLELCVKFVSRERRARRKKHGLRPKRYLDPMDRSVEGNPSWPVRRERDRARAYAAG
jgi:hypothetical protein